MEVTDTVTEAMSVESAEVESSSKPSVLAPTKFVFRAVPLTFDDATVYESKSIETSGYKLEGRLFKKLLKSWSVTPGEYRAFLKHRMLDELPGIGSSPPTVMMESNWFMIRYFGELRLDALSHYLATTYPTTLDETGTLYTYIEREGILIQYEPFGTKLTFVRHDPDNRAVSTSLSIKTKKLLQQTAIEWETAFSTFSSDDAFKPGIYNEQLSKVSVTVAELLHFDKFLPLAVRHELERVMNMSLDLISEMPLKALQRMKVNISATKLLGFVSHEDLATVFEKAAFTRYFARGHNDESFEFKSLNLSV